jgi:quinol monooxygenase YgiN
MWILRKQLGAPSMRLIHMGIGLIILSSNLSAQDDGPLGLIKGQLKDVNKPFAIVVTIEAKQDKVKELIEAFADPIKQTRKEKGNLRYELNQDPKEPTKFVLYEKWANFEAVKTHFGEPYLTKLLADAGSLTTALDLKVMLPVAEQTN